MSEPTQQVIPMSARPARRPAEYLSMAVAGAALTIFVSVAPASAQTLTEALSYSYNSNPQLLAQRARNNCNAPRIGQQAAEYQVPRNAREERTPVMLLDLRARGFDQLAVLDAGGAGGLAGTAIEALIDVLYE